jgi:multicomponent Na+:H+ antiporter subunit B
MRNLFAAAMATGIYSFLGAGWMLLLDAPDVAFTEAAVGAGVSTVLMLGTLSLTTTRTRDPRIHWPSLVVVVATGAVLIYGTLDMPHYGDPKAPAHTHPRLDYVRRTQEDIDVPNVVTAVLGSYRGYDTLGETVVIFTAGIAVTLLLRRGREVRAERKEPAS